MLRKKCLAIFSLIMLAPLIIGAMPLHSPSAPSGKYLVYSAAGVYDPSIPPVEGDLLHWFHAEIMGRDDQAIEAERDAADSYFQEMFGDLYISGSLKSFAVDPRDEYRAYYISGMCVPPDGWIVRNGGFGAILFNGGIVFYGDYNIKVANWGEEAPDPEPIIIHYESVEPIYPTPSGILFFRYRLHSESFDDFGGGIAQGIFATRRHPDGVRTVADIHNILTFPGHGLDAQ